MSGCRISRVRLKSGGEIVPLRTAPRDELQKTIVDHAATIAGNFKPGELDGFLIVGWDKEGAYSHGLRLNREGLIGVTLFPSWISDIARKTMIVGEHWE